VLRLVHVLHGVQPRSLRQMPFLPPPWQEVGFSEVVTDSREVTEGSLFLALAGARTDGHDFLSDVLARGARGAFVVRGEVEARRAVLEANERAWVLLDPATGAELAEAPPDACLFIAVDDPLMAVQRLAVYHRRQLTPTVVGITGSVGKTSTKEVVAAVLRRRFRTLKSKRSFNSDATLPTTLLQLVPEHEVAVLELGMWAPGEIRFLASLARPHVGIVTNVGPSHLERLGSMEAIVAAKAELPESLPEDGWCILNADDEQVAAMASLTSAQVLTYGLSAAADIRAAEIVSHGLEGLSFRIDAGDESLAVRVPLIGRHSVHNVLAAVAVGRVLGMAWDEIVAALQDQPEQLRLFVVAGVGGSTIIDDTYNAAPASNLAALSLLDDLDGRRIAVLGDMLELGAAEETGHRLVGRRVAEVAQVLVAVGSRAYWYVEEARAAGMADEQTFLCETNEAAIQVLTQMLQSGDYALVKGSRALEMEQIVAALQRRLPEES
jgi:UDP-N-acetylmuramoyl-tripeptide--D-alanyl-D-alanine ligase